MSNSHYSENCSIVQFAKNAKKSHWVPTAAFALAGLIAPTAWASACNEVTSGLVACYPFDGNANDESGNNLNGSVIGATLTSDRTGTNGRAYYFNGSSYINVGNSPKFDVNYHTITAWIKPEAKLPKTGYNLGRAIVGKVKPFTYETLSFGLEPDNYFATGFATGSEVNHPLKSLSVISDNQWHFVVVTYDGSKVMFYLNGLIDVSYPRTGIMRTTTSGLAIGRHGGDTNQLGDDVFFKGSIDDVRIYNRALTEVEVRQLFELGTKSTLTVAKTGNGTVTGQGINCGTDCTEDLVPNTIVTLTAVPDANSVFEQWTGDCAGTTTTCQITLDAAKSVTANFSATTGGGNAIWPSCSDPARYSIEDYTLTVPALEVPLLSFLGEALGESLYYETVLKQINGTNDRFVLQKITELVKVETDATCAKFDLDQGLATLPVVEVKLPVPGPLNVKDYGFYTEQYAVTLKWMPILGKEVFVIESINKIAE